MFRNWESISNVKGQDIPQQFFKIGNTKVIRQDTSHQCEKIENNSAM